MTLERCQCDGRGEAAQMTHATPCPSQRNPGRYSVYNESLRHSHCLACRHKNNSLLVLLTLRRTIAERVICSSERITSLCEWEQMRHEWTYKSQQTQRGQP